MTPDERNPELRPADPSYSATRRALLLGAAAQFLGSASPVSAAGFEWKRYSGRPDEWFRSEEAARIAENILSHQSPEGSWPKNQDSSAMKYVGDPRRLSGTFDNGASLGEIRFLNRSGQATGSEPQRAAVLRGIDVVLKAQYPTGGWPQYYPPPKTSYHRHITFNDGTFSNLMEFVRDLANSTEFSHLDGDRRRRAADAFAHGIGCILKCQIRVKGLATVWCAQHDEITLEPRKGRAYEHASLSGSESAGVARLLMSLQAPSREVVQSVHAAARWFESARLTGIRVERRDGDRIVVADPAAPPLWARFYEIETNRPIFSGRDGIIRFQFSEIEKERRTGYAWYGDWGTQLLKEYDVWKRSHPEVPKDE